MYLVILWLMFGGDIDRLGHDDWRTRERAEQRLRDSGYWTWKMCRWSATRHPDPQVRASSRQIANDYLWGGQWSPLSSVMGVEDSVAYYVEWPNERLRCRFDVLGSDHLGWRQQFFVWWSSPFLVLDAQRMSYSWWSTDEPLMTGRLAHRLLSLGAPPGVVRRYLGKN